MATEAALIKVIQSDPHDRLAVKVYADWLQENRDLGRFGALREATRHRLPLLREYEIRTVEGMLRTGDPFNHVCHAIIQRACPYLMHGTETINVVRRYFPHSSHLGLYPFVGRQQGRPVMWVSARWLLNRLNASSLMKSADGRVMFLDDWRAEENFLNNAW